jgi:hypothetical protein
MDPTNATTTYNNLKAYVINGKPYINAASTDPAQSTIECNLQGACGAEAMPKAGPPANAPPATATDIAKVDTWLKCGAPNN